MGTAALALVPGLASAATQAPASHTLAPNTRFYVPPPAQGSVQQILQLVKSGQLKNAGLIAAMESVPSAVWLDGETAAQAAEPGNQGSQQADAAVARQVRLTLAAARLENAVPIFVAYNIPGRDCSQYSAGGAPTDADYHAWINAIGGALGNAKAVVLEEPDSLADLPGYCGAAYAADFPGITNTTRVGDVAYAVSTLEADPNISLYLDGGNSAWQNVGGMAETLTAADVQQSQGFFLNVSNYQYDTNSDYYGTWVSACIAYATANEAQTPADALADVAAFTGNVHPARRLRLPGLPADHAARRLRDPVLERRRPRNQHRQPGRRLHRRRAEPVRRLERDVPRRPTSTPPASTPATPAPWPAPSRPPTSSSTRAATASARTACSPTRPRPTTSPPASSAACRRATGATRPAPASGSSRRPTPASR